MIKAYLYIILLSFIYTQHFNLEITETGESTLFIFDENIPILNNNDEIGIFDTNGILDSQGNTGLLLVGTGLWNSEQLEVVTIGGIDLSQFGGPILPGYSQGSSILIKIWDFSEQTEIDVNYTVSTGNGTFNGLFSVINNIDCGSSENECDCFGNILDECGVCNGDGQIFECGCYDIPEGNCNCSGGITDCNNECGGDSVIDECGICDGNNLACNESQVLLGLYPLDGGILTYISYDNLSEEACINNPLFLGINSESLVVSTSECIDLIEPSGTIPIYIKNTQNITGFQFSISGLNVINTFGGIVSESNFTISTNTLENNNTLQGFSLTGNIIEEIGNFYGCIDLESCNFNQWAEISDNSCIYSDLGYDCDGNCINYDCNNECNGSAIYDECGICNGNGPNFWCEELDTYICFEDDCSNNGSTGGTGGSTGGDGNEDTISYTSDIQTIFDSNCTSYCHSNSNHESGLDLSSYQGLILGGNSGDVVIPGNSTYSLLIQKLQGLAPGLPMPPENSLDGTTIDLISQWIDQGAIGPDDNDGGQNNCNNNEILDCNENCIDINYLEDGNCNDGISTIANLNCAEYFFDGDCIDNFENCSPDCPVGILKFGDINVSLNNETNIVSGDIEIIMDCEFDVSDFNIAFSSYDPNDTLPPIITDFNINDIIGGTALASNFDIVPQDNSLSASNNDSNLLSGEQTILNINFETNGDKICFENSNITTSIGIQYQAILDKCIPLAHYYEGWNWISFNQLFTDMSLDSIFNEIESPTYIKSQSEYADYYNDFGWFGTLENIDNLSMYKINMLSSDALALRGEYINIDSTIFSLNSGWNWIGYSPEDSYTLENALFNIPNGYATYIKSQSEYADYYSEFGWFGTLETMNPLNGYLIYLNENIDFIYNTYDNFDRNIISSKLSYNDIETNLNIHNYEYNGSITSILTDSNSLEIINPTNYILLAYNSSNNCIGKATSKHSPLNNKIIHPIMIYGNNSDIISFKAYNTLSGEYYDIEQNIIFEPDMRMGNAKYPEILNLKNHEMDEEIISTYPNPFNPSINIDFNLVDNSVVDLSIYNINGQKIENLVNSYIHKGKHSVIWNATSQSSGIYFVKININNIGSNIKKIVLIK